ALHGFSQRHSLMQMIFIVFTPGTLQFEIKTAGEISHPAVQKFLRLWIAPRQQGHANIAPLATGKRDYSLTMLAHPSALYISNTLLLAVLPGARNQLNNIFVADIIHRQQCQQRRFAFAVTITNPKIAADNRFNTRALR